MTTPKIGMRVKCIIGCDCGCGLIEGKTFTIIGLDEVDNETVVYLNTGEEVKLVHFCFGGYEGYLIELIEDEQLEFDF